MKKHILLAMSGLLFVAGTSFGMVIKEAEGTSAPTESSVEIPPFPGCETKDGVLLSDIVTEEVSLSRVAQAKALPGKGVAYVKNLIKIPSGQQVQDFFVDNKYWIGGLIGLGGLGYVAYHSSPWLQKQAKSVFVMLGIQKEKKALKLVNN